MWYVLLTVCRYQGGAAFIELGPFHQREYPEELGQAWSKATPGDNSFLVFTKAPIPEPPVSDPHMP